MSDDLLITPASRKIEFKDSSANVDAKIETDANGNLIITNTGGDITIGDTTSDVFIGDGTNSVDIVFEQNGEIRGTTGVTVTLGASDSNVRMATDLNLNSNDITNVNNINITGTSESLANQPAVPVTVEDGGTTDGRVFMSIKHGSASSTASALGAGIRMIANDGSGTSSYWPAYMFVQGGSEAGTVKLIAPKDFDFYVDHHDNSIDSTLGHDLFL